MESSSPIMFVMADDADTEFANQLANSLGYTQAEIVLGSPLDAAKIISERGNSPSYVVIDIGNRSGDILPELDALAENCESNTRVIIIGAVNDVNFYRELRQRGVVEYFTRPASVSDIRAAMLNHSVRSTSQQGTVISFMSAASGDGASTIALNTAFSLAHDLKQPTVIVDMDYQFGMIAKNLDLTSPFGIKELFEHPDRGIDSTLVERMLVDYGHNLKVIAAPNELRMLPMVKPEIIRDLILTLQEQFKYVIIDLPHLWSTWVAAALSNTQHRVMVGQLWLRSVTHTSRLLNVWRDIGIDKDSISIIINRSGAKYKEAVTAKDFERVCGKEIDFYLPNDIKTVVAAENEGKTILEVGHSMLERQIRELSQSLLPEKNGQNTNRSVSSPMKSGLSSLLKPRK